MTGRHAGSGLKRLLPALLAVAAIATAGIAMAAEDPGREPGSSAPPSVAPAASVPDVAVPAEAPTTSPPSTSDKGRSPAQSLPGAGPPTRVVVESLGIDAHVIPVSTDSATLDPPDDPQLLGWWAAGARPGAARGSALVTGHTVHSGGGAMDDLETVRRGAAVRVTTEGGSIGYVVESVRVLDKTALAREAQRLFSQTVRGRLVLVTCEDWDGTGYRSNVVVTAVPAD